MSIEKTIQDLRARNNILMVENEILFARVSSLTALVLSTCKANMSAEDYKDQLRNFAESLKADYQTAFFYLYGAVSDVEMVKLRESDVFGELDNLLLDS